MITVKVEYDGAGSVTGWQVRGHAGSSSGDYDLVCNSVSVVTQAPVLGLERYLKRHPRLEVDEDAGVLSVTLDEVDAETQAVAMTMVVTLESLAQRYPQYVRLEEQR